MVTRTRGGFTLVEAIIALTLSSVLVILVGTVFLVQNRYYATQLARTVAQDNARMVTEVVAGELRSLTDSAVVTADSRLLVVRSPMVMAVVCARSGSGGSARVTVHFEGGEDRLDADEVSGFGILNPVTGRWSYHDLPIPQRWDRISARGGSGSPADDCAANGADTAGVRDEFQRLARIDTYAGTWPDPGTVMMVYRRVEYRIGTSTMEPASLGLFRGITGETPVELATGLDETARFQYRTGGSSYANSVTGASLGAIDAIRIVAQARTRPQAGDAQDVTYGWAVNVHLRNAR